MTFDYSRLKGKIKEYFDTQKCFAEALEISSASLSYKLNNLSYFTQSEILKSIEFLKIPIEEIEKYFFTVNTRYKNQGGG